MALKLSERFKQSEMIKSIELRGQEGSTAVLEGKGLLPALRSNPVNIYVPVYSRE